MRKKITIPLRFIIVVSAISVFALLSGCSSTGWTDVDPVKHTGIYYGGTGQNYSGGMINDNFNGQGTYYWISLRAQNRSDIAFAYPLAIAGTSLETTWKDDHVVAHAKATFRASNFVYVGEWDGGTKGNGAVTFSNGMRLEGK